MKRYVTSVPPTTPGACCTKCRARPQQGIHAAKLDGVPDEQRAWCAKCRSNAQVWARRKARSKLDAQVATRGRRCCPGCGSVVIGRYLHCQPCRLAGVIARAA